MRLSAPLLTCSLLLAALGGCGGPTIDEYEPHNGIITGTILYPRGTERGNVIVLLFGESNPPPPVGTGEPVNFVVVSKQAIFRDMPAGVVGDFTAPFTIPTVPQGRYTVRAFLDADEDFNPTQDLLAQPTAGDVGGGHIDLATRDFLPVEVLNDRVTAQITVTLGFTYPVERPAFRFTSVTSFDVPLAAPAMLTLAAHPIDAPPVTMDPARTLFRIEYADEDGNGLPDDVNGDHLPDVYPKVLLVKSPSSEAETIIIPGIINPLPFIDAFAATGTAAVSSLEVIIPPVAIRRTPGGDQLLTEIPPGNYATVVISGTGQTWQVPNALGSPSADESQGAFVTMVGAATPGGRMMGSLTSSREETSDAYVVVFRADDPPPPVGTGRPVALASIPAARFVASGASVEAPFEISGLLDGSYLVRAFLDVDRNFSPFSELLAQPSASDVAGSAPDVVTIAGGGTVADMRISVDSPVQFDRPVFEFDETEISHARLPAKLELRVHPLALFGGSDASRKIPVVLTDGDQDGDNLRDLYPRVILTKMVDGEVDPRTAPDDPIRIIIPAMVDPIPYVSLLASGVPGIPVSALQVIIPPIAVRLGAGGERELITPVPTGRYRVNLLSATGQTWSVPSALDIDLERVGTPRADPTQARVVKISGAPPPRGAITGEVELLAAPPAGDFQVVVLAFDRANPPPPLGSGRPRASAVLSKAAFAGGMTAAYALRGLSTGTYQVAAFLDADDDFVPWFDTMNQPNRGDLAGGHLSLESGTLVDVLVDALGSPSAGVRVVLVPALAYANDRPLFTLSPEGAVLDPSAGPLTVEVVAVHEESDILKQEGQLPVQWVDLDRSGSADDLDHDGEPDVFPRVVAELLDPGDPTGATPSPSGVRIFGVVHASQFPADVFPSDDPTQVQSVARVERMTVVFPPIALDASQSPITPPDGRYRVTVINARGQTWTIPNELARQQGTSLGMTQARYLSVRD